ncbi:MAG: ornithine cyclodeaminase family protein [Acidobacteriota bacterium]|nr:ornithine cyclodeaminase family protein [Acidobacteriota bacterium]
MTLYFPESLVREALPMRDALDAVEEVFRELGEGGAQNGPRQRVRVPGRMLHTMSASSAALGYLGLKTYLTARDGMRFVLLLFDQETGSLAAIMEADALGQIRTGAATGVAADYLAAPGASSAGIVGCGYQAETQLEALALVRPLTRVEAFCRNPERRARFARKMSGRLGVEVVPAPSGEAAVRGKPIVVAVTSSAEPVVRGAWLAPGALVVAAGGNSLGRRELDSAAVRHAGRIVVDDREQARIECGDLAPLVASGKLAWDGLETLGEVVAAGKRSAAAGPALFESQGIAAEDIAAAAVVYRRAKADATPFAATG